MDFAGPMFSHKSKNDFVEQPEERNLNDQIWMLNINFPLLSPREILVKKSKYGNDERLISNSSNQPFIGQIKSIDDER